ncbi:MAG: hypothetical protein WC824_14000 [Bacteroidota bacterium]
MANAEIGDFWSDVIGETKTGSEDMGPDFDPSQVQFGGGASHSVIDEVLGHRTLSSSQYTSMRALTDKAREQSSLALPVNAGTRVAFLANLGSVLSYSDVPHPACEGTVVTVKTANGPATYQGSDVFFLWDDSNFRVIRAEHLKLGSPRKTANNFRMVVSDLGDISSMFVNAGSGDDLVHKATKDLWSCHKDGGNYVIERLFDDTGKPLKV